jgi:S-adenosylmethionine:tRNA ribosyltransferase-isomerase
MAVVCSTKTKFSDVQLTDFDFELPDALIAQQPLPERSDSRLLHVTANGLADQQIRDLPTLLNPGDLLIVNDSQVMPARLFGNKETGGKVEILIERVLSTNTALAMVRSSKSPPTGSRINLQDGAVITVTGRAEQFFCLAFADPVHEIMQRAGALPLPPYISRDAGSYDQTRYQTIFAQHAGSVAAPTAGLHFDDELVAALKNKDIDIARVTLHVGAGTFSPVRVDDINEHKMHSERYEISDLTAQKIQSTQQNGGRIVAVGTTALRTLESAARDGAGQCQPGSGETDIFIKPGSQFALVDRLLTNFHLPRSTLLMLVSAFAGVEPIRNAYQHAVANQYRFFSYGDAMLLDVVPPGRS